MQLTPEQKEQIKAKKMKRIEKHGKIIKKVDILSWNLLQTTQISNYKHHATNLAFKIKPINLLL